MIKKGILQEGDKVYYQPEHYKKDDKFENGIVKEIPEHTDYAVRVVYNCGGNWANYKNYTSALTNLRDLNKGWYGERTLSQLSTDIENAIKDIQILSEIKYKEYCKLKNLEFLELTENRNKINKLGMTRINDMAKKRVYTIKERVKLQRAKLKHYEKMKKYDSKISQRMKTLKRYYMSDINTIIKQTCDKYRVNIKHVKRIMK